LLGYEGLTSERSLHKALNSQNATGRELFYPKSGITHYDGIVAKNPYAKFLEPIGRRYFGEIPSTDKRLMDHCYVFARGTHQVEEGIKTRLSDEMTAYFRADGTQEVENIRQGGKLAERIA